MSTDDTASVLTEEMVDAAEREYRASDLDGRALTRAMIAAALAAQPPQDDPQPDEREARAWDRAVREVAGADPQAIHNPYDAGRA